MLDERVEVYWNLHKGMWSVRNCRTGRVIGRWEAVHLKDVQFVVQPAGRERVRREKRKNVHAFCRGTLTTGWNWLGVELTEGASEVYYNPYKVDSFVLADDHRVKVKEAAYVRLSEDREVFAVLPTVIVPPWYEGEAFLSAHRSYKVQSEAQA